MKIAKGLLYGVLACSLFGIIGCAEQPQQSGQPKQEQNQQAPKEEKLTFSDPRLQRISEKFDTKYTQQELPQENLVKYDLMELTFEYKNGTVYKADESGYFSLNSYQVKKENELYDWQKDDIVTLFVLNGGDGQPPYALEQIKEAKARTKDKDVLEVLTELEKGLKEMPNDIVLGKTSEEDRKKYPVIQKYKEVELAMQKENYEENKKK
ncbi:MULTISPECIES: hypothetical protein [Aneurinibacillus]|uniref:Lipoprotein n=1 Tax=Aneurinibacillus danicus TaxID=267746 RepID=A0A511VAB7_9BACL|nr:MULTISPECIES: hypothetical protein [Aneurinibacillus]GEN34513.1 hypothetical protein ADA01nite_19730 [Aneurinibacillus danicus]